MVMRPSWVDQELFPFDSHYVEVDGAQVHYLDEGQGPVFLALHGNPTWSFLYRHIINGLSDRFRCIALDYPGFGLSTAPPGYRYTVAEHSRVVEGFVTRLGLDGITLMGQDWGGPIGLSVAIRHPERFRALVIGNTFGWPVRGDKTFERFSKVMGSAFPGGLLVRRLDLFTRVFVPGGIKRKKLSRAEKAMYRRPHPTARSRVPVHVLPREILAADELLSEVEQGLPRLAHLPARPRPGVQGAAATPLGTDLSQPSDGHPSWCLPLHPGRRTRGDRDRHQAMVARDLAMDVLPPQSSVKSAVMADAGGLTGGT